MIPNIELTDAAARKLLAATRDLGDDGCIHVFVDERWEHGLDVGPRADGAIAIERGGVTLIVRPELAPLLNGLTIDYVSGPDGTGFRLDNPNAPATVESMSVRELARRLDAGDELLLLDVRTEREVAIASLPGARRIDMHDVDALIELDRDTPLAFICHHGIRSHAAARFFVQRGFRRVYNVTGGIDAWSIDVDPTVPRY